MRYHLDAFGLLRYTTDDFQTSESFTVVPPPETGPREIAQWSAVLEQWITLPDWRGVDLYDTTTGQPTRLTLVGDTPVGLTPLRPEPGYVWDGSAWQPPTTDQYLAAQRLQACTEVDATADRCRLLVVGDPLRVVEYQRAADEAQHFMDTGEALPAVLDWANAKGWTAEQSAQNILDESRAWNGVLYAIRDTRLSYKEQIRNAPLDQVTTLKDSAKLALVNLISGVGNATPTG